MENSTKNPTETVYKKIQGVPLRRMIIVIAIVLVLICVLLFVGLYFTFRGYKRLINVTQDYVEQEERAKDMMISSDYLTEQAREFAETGNKEYLDNYFTEAEETKRRDNALAYIKELFPDSDAYKNLLKAIDESVKLMDTEYKAMRLKAESMGEDLSTYPQKVREIPLSAEEAALGAEEKAEKARLILFDHKYTSTKDKISASTNECLKQLVKELDARQDEAEYRLRFALTYEGGLIIVFILLALLAIVMTYNQVFNPLIRSIAIIEKDSPLPLQGAYELRMLAYTYNVMYEANRKSKTHLKFNAEHDALTGTLNRRAFDKVCESAKEEPLALLIMDVDNFKIINDTHGHLAGDQVLIDLVKTMQANFRSNDCIFRIGGDEFAVILFGMEESNEQIILKIFNRINYALAENAKNGAPEVTISAGVAFGSNLERETLEHADLALYESKKGGKCACSFYKQ